jgi:hypothetical protein
LQSSIWLLFTSIESYQKEKYVIDDELHESMKIKTLIIVVFTVLIKLFSSLLIIMYKIDWYHVLFIYIYIYIYYCEIFYLIKLRSYRIRLTSNRFDKIRRTSIRESSWKLWSIQFDRTSIRESNLNFCSKLNFTITLMIILIKKSR